MELDTSIKAADTESVKKYHSIVKYNLREYVKDLEISPYTSNFKDLLDKGYVEINERFYHPLLCVKGESKKADLLFKLAILENMDREFTGTTISDFIFKVDKYREYRCLDSNMVDSIKRFNSAITPDRSCNVGRIREQGTIEGSMLYKSVRRHDFKDQNEKYLLYHQHGTTNNVNLICHIRGTPLTGRTMTNFSTNELVVIRDYQVHHVLYKDKKSFHKTFEPSTILGKQSFMEFTHDEHLEFMGCIILSGDGHDSIHNSNTVDGIDNWFKRLAKKECISLPWFWLSEVNYNTYLLWLSAHTKYFRIKDAPKYDDFISKHSISVVAQERHHLVSTVLQIFDWSHGAKTDPSEQTPSLCT